MRCLPLPCSARRPGREAGSSHRGSPQDSCPNATSTREIIIDAGARLKAYLVDDELVKFDLPSTDLLPYGGQVLVDVLYDDLRSFTGEDLVQDVTAAPFSITSTTRMSLHIPRNGLG